MDCYSYGSSLQLSGSITNDRRFCLSAFFCFPKQCYPTPIHFPFIHRVVRFTLPRAKLHLHLSCALLCSRPCCSLFQAVLRDVTCSVPVCWVNTFHIERASTQHANRHVFVFFSLHGPSKHVILLEKMEGELVTIGFV